MRRASVVSSNIRSIGYDESSRTLEIEFTSGGIYQYYEVPPSVHKGLMQASSHGEYLAAHIKNIYGYRRID